MDHTSQSRPPTWNAGGWFGAQLGGTVWLAIAAAFLADRSMTVASIVLALFFVANGVGGVLWRQRSRMSLFSGMQVLLAAIWACSIAAIFAIDRAGLWDTLSVGGRNNPSALRTYVMVTVLVLALELLFQLLQHKKSPAAP